MSTLQPIYTAAATDPHGHYVQAIKHNGVVYVSGLLGNSQDAHIEGERDIEVQAEHCLDQLEAILSEGGSALSQVIKLSVFVEDVTEWPLVNAICATRFGAHKPARIVVPCKPMRFGSRIELDATAAT